MSELRTLMAHCYYRERGGEDASFEAESRLLEERGVRVTRCIRDNRGIDERGAVAKVRLARSAVWSREAHGDVGRMLAQAPPVVAHFQNTWPLLSPSVYDACREHGVPVVQSLRNYRLMCPNGILYRDGRVCEDCVGRRMPWPGVLHACYRSSRAQSAVVAWMLYRHNRRGTWREKVDVYVALTRFARAKFVEAGLPADRIVVKPNCVADPGRGPEVPVGGAVLFVGRLSPEKGAADLLAAAARLRLADRVRVVGDGPERARLEAAGGATFLGACDAGRVVDEMRRAAVVVVPSRWYETFGRVVVEAYACGRPVIVARHGALAELVEDGRTGLAYEPGNVERLAEALEFALGDAESLRSMGREARRTYEDRYRPELNYRMIMGVYRHAVERAGRPVPEPLKPFAAADPSRAPDAWVAGHV